MKRSRGGPPSLRQLRVGEELRHALVRVLAKGRLDDPVPAEADVDGVDVVWMVASAMWSGHGRVGRRALSGDPLADTEEDVLAPFDGIVIGRSNLPLAHEGEALFNIAAFKSVARAEDKVEAFTATHV